MDEFPKNVKGWMYGLLWVAVAIFILNTVANHVPQFGSIESGV